MAEWDAADESLKSFAHMAVAAQVGCSWCLDLGYFEAQNQNLDMAKASQVPRWREADVFTPLERDVLEYAEAMTNTPPTVSDELCARLLERLGPAALVELTATSPSPTSRRGATWRSGSSRRASRPPARSRWPRDAGLAA